MSIRANQQSRKERKSDDEEKRTEEQEAHSLRDEVFLLCFLNATTSENGENVSHTVQYLSNGLCVFEALFNKAKNENILCRLIFISTQVK